MNELMIDPAPARSKPSSPSSDFNFHVAAGYVEKSLHVRIIRFVECMGHFPITPLFILCTAHRYLLSLSFGRRAAATTAAAATAEEEAMRCSAMA